MCSSKVCKPDFSRTATIQYSESTLFAEWKPVAIVCTIHHHVLKDTTSKSTLYCVHEMKSNNVTYFKLLKLQYCSSNTWDPPPPLSFSVSLSKLFHTKRSYVIKIIHLKICSNILSQSGSCIVKRQWSPHVDLLDSRICTSIQTSSLF